MVGTEEGKILIFESNGELRAEIAHTHGPNQQPRSINTMLTYSKGFICGGSNGSIAIYDRNDEAGGSAVAQQTTSAQPGQNASKELYKKAKEMVVQDETSKVVNMAISPSEDNLVCTTETNQIFALMLAGTEVKVCMTWHSWAWGP